jgi:hypothetical protein
MHPARFCPAQERQWPTGVNSGEMACTICDLWLIFQQPENAKCNLLLLRDEKSPRAINSSLTMQVQILTAISAFSDLYWSKNDGFQC